MLILDFDEDDLPPLPLLEGDEVKSETQENIAERIKLNPWKRKTTGTGLKKFNSKQVINSTSITISSNKSWKQFT